MKEQITRALQVQPRSFEVLKTRLQTLTYQDILKLWAEDRQKKEDWESQAKPIMLVLKLLLYSGLFFVGVNLGFSLKRVYKIFLAVIICSKLYQYLCIYTLNLEKFILAILFYPKK